MTSPRIMTNLYTIAYLCSHSSRFWSGTDVQQSGNVGSWSRVGPTLCRQRRRIDAEKGHGGSLKTTYGRGQGQRLHYETMRMEPSKFWQNSRNKSIQCFRGRGLAQRRKGMSILPKPTGLRPKQKKTMVGDHPATGGCSQIDQVSVRPYINRRPSRIALPPKAS